MSPQSLHHVLSAYSAGYLPQNWSSPGASGGFSGAVILRIETRLGPFCLRGWPRGALPRERILGLHRLLRFVFDAGLKEIAVPIPAKNGETLVHQQQQDWQLEPWLPGQADFWSEPSQDKLRDVMALLARFHQITRNYADEGPAWEWFHSEEQAPSPAVRERLAYLREWQTSKLPRLRAALPAERREDLRELGRELSARFERLAPIIGTQLEILSRLSFRLQPCIRDLWHDHVLFAGETVTGLVDLSACRAENIATDLARLLGSLVRDDRDAWKFAIGEYESKNPLAPPEKMLIEALDQSGVLLAGMTWMDRLVLRREVFPHWPKVRDRLESIAERLKTLDANITKTHW